MNTYREGQPVQRDRPPRFRPTIAPRLAWWRGAPAVVYVLVVLFGWALGWGIHQYRTDHPNDPTYPVYSPRRGP